MADVPLVSPVDFQALRTALGRNRRADGRLETLIALALMGPTNQRSLADRRGLTATGAKEHVESLEADGLASVSHPEHRHSVYEATPTGERIALMLEALRTGQLGIELVGRVLVCATRAEGRSDRSLREAMLDRAGTVLTGYGSLQYVGICRNDPELVEALQGRIEKLKAQPSMLRIEQIVSA